MKISTIPGEDISNIYILDERNTGNTSIKIREGHLTASTVRFSFKRSVMDYFIEPIKGNLKNSIKEK